MDAPVDLRVWVSGALGTEFPYTPIRAMFRIEELDKRIERVAISALRVGSRRARGGDYLNSDTVRGDNSADVEHEKAILLSVT